MRPPSFRTKNFWHLLAFIIFCAVAAGFFILGRENGRSDLGVLRDGEAQEKHQGGYKFINPLLECQAPASYSNVMTRLEKQLSDVVDEAISEGLASHVSIYLRDLSNGPWIGINEDEKFSPASLMKVPILISYFKAAESDPKLLSRKIRVTQERSDTLSQNIRPDMQAETGKEYMIGELIEIMIRYSDNLAANTLVAQSEGLMERVHADLDIFIPEDKAENFISVRDYAGFFRILYNASYLNREMSERALSLLTTTDFQEGIVAGLPSYVPVAHKFGERRLEDSVQLHDCGIVYRSGSPYLLCVMTRGRDFESMESVIRDISELSFKWR